MASRLIYDQKLYAEALWVTDNVRGIDNERKIATNAIYSKAEMKLSQHEVFSQTFSYQSISTQAQSHQLICKQSRLQKHWLQPKFDELFHSICTRVQSELTQESNSPGNSICALDTNRQFTIRTLKLKQLESAPNLIGRNESKLI